MKLFLTYPSSDFKSPKIYTLHCKDYMTVEENRKQCFSLMNNSVSSLKINYFTQKCKNLKKKKKVSLDINNTDIIKSFTQVWPYGVCFAKTTLDRT